MDETTLLASFLLAAAFFASASSSSGLYPSFSMRSASSFAFFSASSKSIRSVVTFFAPSLDPAFFAPRTLVFRAPVGPFLSAAECVIRLAAGLASVESVLESGEAVRAMSFPLPFESPGLAKGDGVRPMIGGVAVRETGGVGFLMAGLSQEEKKSSSGSPAGVELPSAASPSAMMTSVGYLICQ